MTEIVWQPSMDACCLYSLWLAMHGRREVASIADAELQQALSGALRQADVGSQFWRLAESVLQPPAEANRRPAGTEKSELAEPTELDAVWVRLRQQCQQDRPHLADELAQRQAPIRQLWEERGPGFLANARRLTSGDWPAAATVWIVEPTVGGGGFAAPPNGVCLEAMLYHPHPELPETARLGWLLHLLAAARNEPANSWEQRCLSCLLPALESAAYVQWVADPQQVLPLALQAWMQYSPADARSLAQQLGSN